MALRCAARCDIFIFICQILANFIPIRLVFKDRCFVHYQVICGDDFCFLVVVEWLEKVCFFGHPVQQDRIGKFDTSLGKALHLGVNGHVVGRASSGRDSALQR